LLDPRSALCSPLLSSHTRQVPLDIDRRKSAKAEDTNNGVDRPLQLVCIAAIVLPVVWACATQQGPTVAEQLTEWGSVSWGQLTDGKMNLHFQVAAALLFIERLCYTWVHTFSTNFMTFTKTAIGEPPENHTRKTRTKTHTKSAHDTTTKCKRR